MKLFISLVATICVLFSVESRSANVAGIKLDDQIQVDSQTLLLNGAGVREKFIFDIYVIGLYLPEKQPDANVLLSNPPANRVAMQFTYKKVEKEKLDDAWRDGFKDNLSSGKLASLSNRLSTFMAMFDEAVEGDVYHLDYLPGKGTRVTINDSEKGWVEGEDFNSALLSIWIGNKPISSELKGDLLGQ